MTPIARRTVGAFWAIVGVWTLSLGALAQNNRTAAAQTPPTASPSLTKDQLDFFENKIRPLFTNNCYQCHSGPAPASGLELDWRGGWQKGGGSGPVIVPGDPEKSTVVRAVRYTDPSLQMPPDGKLTDAQIGDLVAWIRMGAPDPRTTSLNASVSTITYGGRGKDHWAFQPIAKANPPAVKNTAWAKNDIDRFVLAKLEAEGMTANPPADKRTLIRRAYYDLIGLPPTPEQVNAFVADGSANAFEKVVDALLASPRYGERWGRHWLDVARYADSKGQNDRRRESSLYPYAWTYRDWVIKAFNDDLPYDEFIREQLAADRLNPKNSATTLAALGFLTLGDHFNGMAGDVINDRIDVTSKAFLGLTVTCARCHDHKFDPIPTADYYSLYGIFASSVEPPVKPVIGPNTAATADYAAARKDMDDRINGIREQNISGVFGDYKKLGAAYLMATSMNPNEAATFLRRAGAQPELLQNWVQFTRRGGKGAVAFFGVWNALSRIPPVRFQMQAPRVLANQYEKERASQLSPLILQAFKGKSPHALTEVAETYGKLFARTDPDWEAGFGNVVGDAVLRYLPPRERNQYFALREASDMLDLASPGAPARANVLVDSPAPKDSPILIRGQSETPGPVVPRRFLEVLAGKNRPTYKNGSGRLELANAIASKTNPLTARVMVNRVWQHHFGDGFVSTPDDLGNQSSAPTHPELLDWLANRFMNDGWSIKKLHKLILMSATWQQSTRSNPQFAEKDPFNHLLWRANVRRLEFEPLRDSILAIGGSLDLTMGGHPIDLSGGADPVKGGRGLPPAIGRDPHLQMSAAPRRSVYGFVDRGDLTDVLTTFDFASPDAPSGKRFETIVPQQALFLMNSPLVIEQVRNVVNRAAFQNATSDAERIAFLYELYFQRQPTEAELRTGHDFVTTAQVSGDVPAPPASTGAPGAGRGAARGALARGGQQGRGGPGRGRGAAAPANPPRIPLSSWQEYAHALLMTNETTFIN